MARSGTSSAGRTSSDTRIRRWIMRSNLTRIFGPASCTTSCCSATGGSSRAREWVPDTEMRSKMGTVHGNMTETLRRRWNTTKTCRSSNQPGKRNAGGRKKRFGHNHAERLQKRKDETLQFSHDLSGPFTNNEAESGLRMMMMRMKISGCVRTEQGVYDFAVLRSVANTARKRPCGGGGGGRDRSPAGYPAACWDAVGRQEERHAGNSPP